MNDLKSSTAPEYHVCFLVAALDGALDDARDFARDLARDLDRDRDRDLDRARDLVFALNHALNHALAPTRAPAPDFAFAFALDLERVLNRACPRNSALDSALDLARQLARDIDLARARREGEPAGLRRARAGQAAPSTGRLLAAAARLLPPADRGRYTEEFQCELSDLVAAGAGRRAQLAYAIRLLGVVWPLRAELRAPRRERAAP
jgi:hypothetical protein